METSIGYSYSIARPHFSVILSLTIYNQHKYVFGVAHQLLNKYYLELRADIDQQATTSSTETVSAGSL